MRGSVVRAGVVRAVFAGRGCAWLCAALMVAMTGCAGSKSEPLARKTASVPDAPTEQRASKSGAGEKSATKPATKPAPQAAIKPGSKTGGVGNGGTAGAPVGGGPTYRMLANAQNARAARLGKLWARATVSIDYRDSEGRKRWEQGEGHFQVIQPSKLALSVGKLGEVFLWIGCDEERYWLIDTKGAKAAYVGRHELVTRGKIEALGLPVPPRDLIALAGMSPIAAGTASGSGDPVVVTRGKTASYRVMRGGVPWTIFVDAATLTPVRVEVAESVAGEGDAPEAVIVAELSQYRDVPLKGSSGFFPRVATRVECLHTPSGSTMSVTLTDPSDGGTNRLKPEAFDFEGLVEALGVSEVIDLDEGE